jgi:hypothetical protein
MKIKITGKNKWFLMLIIVILGYGIYYLANSTNNRNPDNQGLVNGINKNVSPDLAKLPNNLYIFLPLKSSFIIPENYKIDDQVFDQEVLIYPNNKSNIKYEGVKSLSSMEGMIIYYSDYIKADQEKFKTIANNFIDKYKIDNPQSDAIGEFLPNIDGKEKFVLKQSKPFAYVHTLLARQYVINILGYAQNDTYNNIITSYSEDKLIPTEDLKDFLLLQSKFSKAFEEKKAQDVFSLLSDDAKKTINQEKIVTSLDKLPIDELKYFVPTGLVCSDGNFIGTSRFQYNVDKMRRVNIAYAVNYNGKKNDWSINSYFVGNEEKFLPRDKNWQVNFGKINLTQ